MNSEVEQILYNWCRYANDTGDYSKVLNLSNKKLYTMPSIPRECEYLDLSINELTNIPILPNNLKHLRIQFNKLISLPQLPESLLTLDLYSNALTQVPRLPNTLVELNISRNIIYMLPEYLPDNLKILKAYSCNLKELPRELPKKLSYLDVSLNLLTTMEDLESLEYLETLNISNNYITSMPKTTKSIQYILFHNNPFTISSDGMYINK